MRVQRRGVVTIILLPMTRRHLLSASIVVAQAVRRICRKYERGRGLEWVLREPFLLHSESAHLKHRCTLRPVIRYLSYGYVIST